MSGRPQGSANESQVWNWVDREVLLALHDESLAEHGGSVGLRDAGLLESVLARSQSLALDGKPDIAELAASYGYDLAKNQIFIDGNKRVALLSMGLFVYTNGHRLTASRDDATQMIRALSAGQLSEQQLAAWIRLWMKPR